MGWHLPLSPIDQALQPPLFYLQVQDTLILGSAALWSTVYILYVVQGFRDKSYGMPIFSLCTNITWDFLYGFIYPTSVGQAVGFIANFLTDCGIVYVAIKFGPAQWKQSPMVANNIGVLMAGGLVTMTLMHLAFIKTIPDINECTLWSSFVCQIIISATSIAQLMSRGNTSGHSWTIWFLRWIGTIGVMSIFTWRYAHYPESYPIVKQPVTIFFWVFTEVMDIIYPFVYYAVEKKEKQQMLKAKSK